jgi:hypothetical protein
MAQVTHYSQTIDMALVEAEFSQFEHNQLEQVAKGYKISTNKI